MEHEGKLTGEVNDTWLHRLYRRLQRLADAGWPGSVVFGWGVLQGCFFPGFVDLFFLPLSLARPAIAYRLALISTIGMVVGSTILFLLGGTALELVEGPVARLLGLTAAGLEEYRVTLGRFGGWAVFVSTISPLSTKLTSIAAGALGVPWPIFLGALLAGRLSRTMLFAWLVRHGGADWLARRLDSQRGSHGHRLPPT